MANKQPFRQGEKILFGIFGAFLVLAIIGYVALEIVRLSSPEPLFEVKTHYDLSDVGQRGSALFRQSQCTSCHRAMRNGTNMGLSLDGVGSKRSVDWLEQFLMNPEAVYPSVTIHHGLGKEAGYVMEMDRNDLHAIAVFLSELRSEQGSSSSPLPPEGRSAFIDSMVKMWAPESWKEKYQDVREREGTVAAEDRDPPPEVQP